MQLDNTAAHLAAIYNAAWHVRDHARPHQQERRAAALHTMGLAARAAFNASENFEPLLYAIQRGLTERD